jgi:outer membrane protein OmpA-like peptidoglycan-associated protein
MFKKAVIGAVALALSANAANAGENKLTKEEGTGMFTGAAAGALVGGPVGAVVGLIVGGILGDSVGHASRADKRAQVLEDELVETRSALSQASAKAAEEQMLSALTERLQGDVMFRTGSSELDEQVITKLAEIGKVLAEHEKLEVQLHGFADPRGNPEENLKLSALRAEAVREALISGGADPAQIALSAHGEDLTTAAKDDVEAYAWERRVSLAIRPLGDASVAQSR